jgi:diaminopimelate epimerase
MPCPVFGVRKKGPEYDGRVPQHFAKYHGLGNDFVVIEGPLMDPERARRLCDRHFGIGADGILTLLPPRAGGDVFMHVYNADGSTAEMCGNGVRCVARFLAASRKLAGRLTIETPAGPKSCTLHDDGTVSVEMGPAKDLGADSVDVEGEATAGWRISMGNPHLVLFAKADAERARRLGPPLELAQGANVGFAFLRHQTSLELVVWERGAGLTLACGTGACAAVAAHVRAGKIAAATPVRVRLPGGELSITASADLTSIVMRGPAERVFEGELA